jgi:hypothetical protein
LPIVIHLNDGEKQVCLEKRNEYILC